MGWKINSERLRETGESIEEKGGGGGGAESHGDREARGEGGE